jgi:stage II sporulation protein R
MKKIYIIILIFILTILSVIGFNGNYHNNQLSSNSIIRIHIRANTNELIDQEVKYDVKDEVIKRITPLIVDANNKTDVKNIINNNLDFIESFVDDILAKKGLNYSCSAHLTNEFFPTRQYDSYTVSSGFYDALIINLGEGKGNNWWCVVYPPLCFTGNENTQNIYYKSKIQEIIDNFFS